MQIMIGDKITFRNKTGATLGTLIVSENTSGAWCGPFTPARHYTGARDLFVAWTKVVNEQGFSVLDEVESRISALDI